MHPSSRLEANPFSTRHVRPGRLAYQFPAGLTAESLTARLARHGWQGQILGPHGVGKTTLLHTWLPTLAAAGRTVSWWTVRAGQRHLPRALTSEAVGWDGTTVVVVDGCEQLRRFDRWRLARLCRRARCGLVVTAHRPVGWPTLAELRTRAETIQGLVSRLLTGVPHQITAADVSAGVARHGHNVRELFFSLYDLHEQRRGG